jgi:2-oxoisovalerate dehydrogenase E1 component alpha subunit
LIALGEWSLERHRVLTEGLEAEIAASWKEAVAYGTLNEGPRLDSGLMFEDVFKEMPPHLERQRVAMRLAAVTAAEAAARAANGSQQDAARTVKD